MTRALQRRVLDILNGAHACSRAAIQQLIDTRIPVLPTFAAAPDDIVVGERNGQMTIGTLGLINGILGPSFLIDAVYEDDGTLREFVPHPEG